jgi:hypothetical protein
LEEIYLTGKTRRIGPDHIRKCIRILQLLEVASQPEEMNIAGFHFHSLQGKPKTMVGARDRELPGHLRLVWRNRLGCRFRGLPLAACDWEDDYGEKERTATRSSGRDSQEDILPSVGLSVTAAAKALGVSRQMLHDILSGRRPLSAVMCLKVCSPRGRLSGIVDAITGILRPEDGRARQECNETGCANQAAQAYGRSARLSQ